MAKRCCIPEHIFNTPKAAPRSNFSKRKQLGPGENMPVSLQREINTASLLNIGGYLSDFQAAMRCKEIASS